MNLFSKEEIVRIQLSHFMIYFRKPSGSGGEDKGLPQLG